MNPLSSDDKSKGSLQDPLHQEPQETHKDLENDSFSEGSQDSDNQNETKPDILQHPLFQHEKDDTLTHLIRVLKPLLGPNPTTEGLENRIERFGALLFRAIFENKKIEDLQNLFKQFDTTNKTICGALIEAGTFYFRCLDCERLQNEQSVTVLCGDCFDNSKHEGHRMLFVKVSEDDKDNGFCDCGDPESINPGGFCANHQSSELNGEEILQRMPQAQVKKCQNVLSKALYGVVSLFEIAGALKKGVNYEAVMVLARGFLDQVLDCLENSYNNISHCFLPIITSIFQAQFSAPLNKLWHNCDNFTTQVDDFNIPVNELPQCKCSIFGSILRVSSLFDEDQQQQFQSVAMTCMKVSNFKEFAAVEMTKYIQVMFPLSFKKKEKYYSDPSRISTLIRVFIISETMTSILVQSGYFGNYITIIKRMFQKNNCLNKQFNQSLHMLESLICGILNPVYRKSTGYIVEKTTLMRDLLEVIGIFQKKFFYSGEISFKTKIEDIKFDKLNVIYRCEKSITLNLENCLRYIAQSPQEEKLNLLKGVTQDWLKQYNSLKEFQEKESEDGKVRVSLALERILCHLILSFNKDVTKESLLEFFTTFLPDLQIDKFAEEILRKVVKHLGLMRLVLFSNETKKNTIDSGYYRLAMGLYERDISLIQIMSLLASPDRLFEAYAESFFSYDKELLGFFKGSGLIENQDNK